jgi:hypothetical protein
LIHFYVGIETVIRGIVFISVCNFWIGKNGTDYSKIPIITPPRAALPLEVHPYSLRAESAMDRSKSILHDLYWVGGITLMIYHEQLQELGEIYSRSQKADDEDFFESLLQELRLLSNNWHDLKKNNELSFSEYTQLIEKKYYLSEKLQLRSGN